MLTNRPISWRRVANAVVIGMLPVVWLALGVAR